MARALYTADTYATWERVGEPYEENGKLYTRARTKCWKCGGSGSYAWFGTCFACNGSGYNGKRVRLYTESEKAAYDKAQERTKAKKAEDAYKAKMERIAHAKERFCEKNGFSNEGITYMAVGDTFSVKETLKSAGYKFNKLLNWHGPQPLEIEGITFIKVKLEEVYEPTGDGYYMEIESAHDNIEKKKYATIDSKSEFIGEVGERVKDILATVEKICTFEGSYGDGVVYTFKDTNENIMTWFTNKDRGVEVGEKVYITGTIKDHQVYHGEKTTLMSRCRLEV